MKRMPISLARLLIALIPLAIGVQQIAIFAFITPYGWVLIGACFASAGALLRYGGEGLFLVCGWTLAIETILAVVLTITGWY